MMVVFGGRTAENKSLKDKELLVTTSNRCHASSNKCLTSSNKKLLETIS